MKLLNKIAPHAHWLLRLLMAAVFINHSIMKFQMGIDKFAAALNMPYFIGLLVALAELGGAIFIIAGGFIYKDLLTRVAGLFHEIGRAHV